MLKNMIIINFLLKHKNEKFQVMKRNFYVIDICNEKDKYEILDDGSLDCELFMKGNNGIVRVTGRSF